MDGVLGTGGEGAAGLFDQFEEDRGDSDLLGEVGLGEAGDLADGMKRVDFGGQAGRAAGFGRFHLTKDTCIYYSVNHDEDGNYQKPKDKDGKHRGFPGSAVSDAGAGGGAVSDINKDRE